MRYGTQWFNSNIFSTSFPLLNDKRYYGTHRRVSKQCTSMPTESVVNLIVRCRVRMVPDECENILLTCLICHLTTTDYRINAFDINLNSKTPGVKPEE